MITRSLAAVGISNYRVVAIPDLHDPPRWVNHVLSYVNDFDIVISNNPETSRLFAEQGYTVKRTTLYKREQYSGHEIRRRLASGGRWASLVPPPVAAIIREVHGQDRLTT